MVLPGHMCMKYGNVLRVEGEKDGNKHVSGVTECEVVGVWHRVGIGSVGP